MKIKSKSYPDRIRSIAAELARLRNAYDVDRVVEKLRLVANELEKNLEKGPLKKN